MNKQLVMILAVLFALVTLISAACYRIIGSDTAIVNQTTCPKVIAQGGTGCLIVACLIREESSNTACFSVNSSDTFGKTECNVVQKPKRFILRRGTCAANPQPISDFPCICTSLRIIEQGEMPGETVNQAELSGEDCGTCPV